MKALVIGGTGPSGPHIVNGLISRGYDVSVLHGGQHEIIFDEEIEHIHVDPHFQETLESGLVNRTFDLTIATYGRIRIAAEGGKGKPERTTCPPSQPHHCPPASWCSEPFAMPCCLAPA